MRLQHARTRGLKERVTRACFAALAAAFVWPSSVHVAAAQASAASITGVAKSASVPGLSMTRTTRIEDPGHKLDAFYAALDASVRGKGITRIAYYGDSHVASDDYTGPLRALLQQRFGAAGLGFVLPARAERWYRRSGVTHSTSQGFRAERVRDRSNNTAALGVYGIALHAERGVASTRVSTLNTQPGYGATRVQLYYATRPDGGSMHVALDDGASRSVSTAGDEGGFGRVDFAAEDGAHSLDIRTANDGPVTLYGAVFERDTPGVVLDMFGIPGARARSQLQWARQLRRHILEERAPQLVVLAYGTNEAGDDEPIADYEENLRNVLAQLRTDAPSAACLLVGPTDRPVRKGRLLTVRPRVQEITVVQRKLARTYGCGFFDTLHFMGGPLAMQRWVRSRPQLGASDYVHLTGTGYEVYGAELYAAIEHGYVGFMHRKRPQRER